MTAFVYCRSARSAAVAAALWVFSCCSVAADAPPPVPVAGIVAPNTLAISPRLVTAGQPTRESLAGLRAAGYDAVISLAPGNTADAVADESALLKGQGIEFVHIPIPWEKPESVHLDAMAAAMQRLHGKKVLVHCQMNMRASAMTFLYRVIHEKQDPAAAWADVRKIWMPNGTWKAYVDNELKRGGVTFKAE
jgi:protein tyrosine phosphatase (PTP) superfamily phosphohydrolase (DUF442 family)